MKEFQIKDLSEAKTIIKWEITRNREAKTLKMNQKDYIQNLLKAEEMTSCHATNFCIKVGSFISID